MANYEPTSLEILFTALVGRLFISIHKDYVNRLKLRGNERVLDFGSGGGTIARLVAERLLVGGGTVTCVDMSQRWMQLLRRRLRRFPNVSYYLGAIDEVPVPARSHDVVLMHFVLHDIPPDEREGVVRQLASKLTRTGHFCLREPLAQIGLSEINAHMQAVGLVQIDARTGRVPTMGETFEGIFCKPD